MTLTLVTFLLLLSKLSVSKKYLVTLENGQSKVILEKSSVKIAASEKDHAKLTTSDQTGAQHSLEYSNEESSSGDDYNKDLDFSENVDQGINSYITSLSRRSFLRSSKFSKSVSNGIKIHYTVPDRLAFGCKMTLICESNLETEQCVFMTPYKKRAFVVKPGANYENGRIQRISRIIKDKLILRRVCGLTVKSMQKKDVGKWRCAVKSLINGKKAYGGAILRVPEPDAWGLCSQIEEISFVPKFTDPPTYVGGPWGVRVDPVIQAGSTLIGGSRFPPRPPLIVDPHGHVDPPAEVSPMAGCQERATRGEEYEGHMSKTDTGRSCQRWTSSKPHKPSKTYRNVGDHNFCRNPSNNTRQINQTPQVWCYTTDPQTRWDYCPVPHCGSPTVAPVGPCQSIASGGKEYRGPVDTTVGGLACQVWTSTSPHKPNTDPTWQPFQPHNQCRSPEPGASRVWCYTLDPAKRWDYCMVPFCRE